MSGTCRLNPHKGLVVGRNGEYVPEDEEGRLESISCDFWKEIERLEHLIVEKKKELEDSKNGFMFWGGYCDGKRVAG